MKTATPDLTRRDVILVLAAIPDNDSCPRGNSTIAGRLNGVNLEGEDLSWLNFNFIDLSDARCAGAAFRACRFHGVWMFDADFTGADLTGAQFHSDLGESTSHLNNAEFADAKLCRVNAQYVTAEGACFLDADLTDAKFNGADLLDAVFDGAILQGADFTGATLREGAFDNARLPHNFNLASINWVPKAGDMPPDDDGNAKARQY
jgi:uncharacterized protein YjbI with pentapeptide repeats